MSYIHYWIKISNVRLNGLPISSQRSISTGPEKIFSQEITWRYSVKKRILQIFTINMKTKLAECFLMKLQACDLQYVQRYLPEVFCKIIKNTFAVKQIQENT